MPAYDLQGDVKRDTKRGDERHDIADDLTAERGSRLELVHRVEFLLHADVAVAEDGLVQLF